LLASLPIGLIVVSEITIPEVEEDCMFGPTADATSDSPVSRGEDVHLFGLAADGNRPYHYSWSGHGGFSSSIQNPIVSPAIAGVYTLTVTDVDGYSDHDSTYVAFYPVFNTTGIVFKDEDGDEIYNDEKDIPIPGAIVEAWLNDELRASDYTDEKGKYFLSAPAGTSYTIEVALPSEVECYNTELGMWDYWSSIEGQKEGVTFPSENQNISVNYHMLNYGPKSFLWELWHAGPIFDKENIVLIHGHKLISTFWRGKCNDIFDKLDNLLQSRENHYNVWQFEYAGLIFGTPYSITTYSDRLGQAMNTITQVTNSTEQSIIAHSMGGIIARQYLATEGKSTIDKLLTLATFHFGILKFKSFTIPALPGAIGEVRPDSRLLWDLNTDMENSTVSEFAAIGGYSSGHTDGSVEIASTSIVRCNPNNGSIVKQLHFYGVDRSHRNIRKITDRNDEVFQLISAFLCGGVSSISSLRPPEETQIYNGHPSLTFAIQEKPSLWQRLWFPYVEVMDSGNRYQGYLEVHSQSDTIEDGSCIYTVLLKPEDEGEARIYYSSGKYRTVQIYRGQSTIVAESIGDS